MKQLGVHHFALLFDDLPGDMSQVDKDSFSTVAQAQAALDAVGLGTVQIGNQIPTGDGGLVGTIVPDSQSPTAGSSVPPGTNVTVDVYIAE